MTWFYLTLAIVVEVIATASLKASDGFENMYYGAASLFGYCIAIVLLGLVMKTVPVGITYAIWSGAGVALITVIGVVVFKQHLDLAAMIGLALIVTGVVVLNVFSNTAGH
jgi:small multidrug resistance pump